MKIEAPNFTAEIVDQNNMGSRTEPFIKLQHRDRHDSIILSREDGRALAQWLLAAADGVAPLATWIGEADAKVWLASIKKTP